MNSERNANTTIFLFNKKCLRFVTRHGGKVEQNYRAGVTSLYVETGMKIKARNMVAMQTVDVVAGKWALDQVT